MKEGLFHIEYEFVDKYVRFAKPAHLQVYIYLLSQFKRLGRMLTVQEIADALDTKERTVASALEYWTMMGIIVKGSDGYKFTKDNTVINKEDNDRRLEPAAQKKPSYSSGEISEAIKGDENLAHLFKRAEALFGKTLSNADAEKIYSFIEWLGLPVEVVEMLICYCVKLLEKKSMYYIEKVAIDWADKEIDTFEVAESYIKKQEKKMGRIGKIRGILGIYDRALTSSEKKYITKWAEASKLSLDLITEAYDRTIQATGKLTMSYMDKILQSWIDNGIYTPVKLAKFDEEFRSAKNSLKRNIEVQSTKKGAGKSKFDNFTTDRATSYEDIEKKALELMMEGAV